MHSSKRVLGADGCVLDESAIETAGCPAWCSTGHGQLVGEDDAVHVGELVLGERWRVRLCGEDGGEVRLLLDEYELGVAELPVFEAALHALSLELGRRPIVLSPAPATAAPPPPDC